jgi:hypothetical protein
MLERPKMKTLKKNKRQRMLERPKMKTLKSVYAKKKKVNIVLQITIIYDQPERTSSEGFD